MPPATDEEVQRRFVMAAYAEMSLGLLAIGLGWFFGPNPHAQVPRLTNGEDIAEGLILGICLGAVLAAGIFALSHLPIRALRELEQTMEARLAEMLSPMTRTELVVLSMAAGIGEELLFRGWLQQGLFGLLGGGDPTTKGGIAMGILGLFLASLAFGLAHPISPLYIVLATGMGLVLGGIYWVTGNLLCAMVAHAAYDAIILLKWNYDLKSKERTRDGS